MVINRNLEETKIFISILISSWTSREIFFLNLFLCTPAKAKEKQSASFRVQLKLSHNPLWPHETKWEGPEKLGNSTRVSPKNLFRNQSREVTVFTVKRSPMWPLWVSSQPLRSQSSSEHALTSPSADSRPLWWKLPCFYSARLSALTEEYNRGKQLSIFLPSSLTMSSVSASFYDIVLKYLNF